MCNGQALPAQESHELKSKLTRPFNCSIFKYRPRYIRPLPISLETETETRMKGSSPVCKHEIHPDSRERAGWLETGKPNLTREINLSGMNEPE